MLTTLTRYAASALSKCMTLIGHQTTWEYLLKVQAQDRLGNAYLLVGPENVGKKTLLQQLFLRWLCREGKGCGACNNCRQLLVGSHPDVHSLNSAGQPIKIQAIRELALRFSQTSVSPLRLALIADAELLTQPAANALLKILEEPPARTSLFLTSSNWSAILPTIRSRCRLLTLRDVEPAALATGLVVLGFAPEDITKLKQDLPYLRPGECLKCLRDQDYWQRKLVLDQAARRILRAENLAQDLLALDVHLTSVEQARDLLHTLLRLIHWQLLMTGAAQGLPAAQRLIRLAAQTDQASLALTSNVKRSLILENLVLASHGLPA